MTPASERRKELEAAIKQCDTDIKKDTNRIRGIEQTLIRTSDPIERARLDEEERHLKSDMASAESARDEFEAELLGS